MPVVKILDRVIGAVMTLRHLHCAGADGQTEHLVTQANAEDRRLGLEQSLDRRDRVSSGLGGIAGPVREKDAVRFQGEDIFRRARRWNNCDRASAVAQQSQNIAFDSVIDGDDAITRLAANSIAGAERPTRLIPIEALRRGDGGHQIHAVDARPRLRLVDQRGAIEFAAGVMGDDGVGHSLATDHPGQRPRVDSRQADDSPRLEPGVQPSGGSEIGGLGDISAKDGAARAGRRRKVDGFDVLLVRSDNADMGESEGDDLAGVGRVGENFLVSGHRGVETHFAHCRAGGADAEGLDRQSVGEDEESRRLASAPPGDLAAGRIGNRLRSRRHGGPCCV